MRRLLPSFLLKQTKSISNILRPLSSRLPSIFHRWSIPFLFLGGILFFFDLLCLLIGSIDLFQALLSKVGFSVGGRSLALFCSRAFGWEGGASLILVGILYLEIESGVRNSMMSSSGASIPSSSSGRPPIDFHFPPPPAPDPREGVDPRPIPLSEAELLILARLGGRGEALGSRLVEEARSIVRLKGEIVEKMFQLDKESPDFWKEKRDAIIKDSIRTMQQRCEADSKAVIKAGRLKWQKCICFRYL